jgi:histidinol-phosphate phosphatase family protein
LAPNREIDKMKHSNKTPLILIDRDGTLIFDNKYHLGRTNDWKKKIKFLPGVIKGIKELRKIPHIKIYMVTNQPGVAIKDFKLLTKERAEQVAQHIEEKLNKRGATIDGHFVCGHASPAYTKKRSQYKFHKKLVCNCTCIKPNFGMVFDALKKEGLKKSGTNIYVIGDRASDVKTALKVKGQGIFVPFKGEKEEIEKINRIKNEKSIYLAKNFTDATKLIIKKEKKKR